MKSQEQWQDDVLRLYPEAGFTIEDGSGLTYGPRGSITAHVGPDMQAEVVGVYDPGEACWIDDGKDNWVVEPIDVRTWNRWFAWFPVRYRNGERVWLKWILRVHCMGVFTDWWEYKPIPPLAWQWDEELWSDSE